MKILFFIESLGSGGAERVVSTLSNEFSQRGHDVMIVTNLLKEVKYDISDGVELLDFSGGKNSKNKFINTLRQLRNYRKILKQTKPDVAIGVMPFAFLLTKLASLGLRIPAIASDHTSFERKLPRHINFIRFKLYRFADAVTILTEADYNYLGSRLPNKVVMPNPLSFEVDNAESLIEDKKNKILAVGRVNEWRLKGYDILLKAWAEVESLFPDWTLEIVGEYNVESKLELAAFISNKIYNERVIFSGFCSNIEEKMSESSIFVLPSRIEGFGLVLIEAMSLGCACISFDTNGRQKEIISSSDIGFLLENKSKEALSKALKTLMANPMLRHKLGDNAILESRKYSLSIIADKWLHLIDKVAEGDES